MEFLYLLNVFFVFFSFWVACQCKAWGSGWWFNMFASAMNAVVLVRAV